MAALVYFTRDAVPPSWSDRMIEVTGLPGVVELLFGPGTDEAGITGLGVPPAETATTRQDSPERVFSRGESGSAEAVTYRVNFSADSELLETDAWHALDSAAVLLRQEPDRLAIISDPASGAEGERPDPELSRARISAVEQYLVAAGIDRERLVGGVRTGFESSARNSDADKRGRLVRISIGSIATE